MQGKSCMRTAAGLCYQNDFNDVIREFYLGISGVWMTPLNFVIGGGKLFQLTTINWLNDIFYIIHPIFFCYIRLYI